MNKSHQIQAAPTKEFFVRMLTRDIDLRDAILDLLDNCVDGVLRSHRSKPSVQTPYKGYRSEITATSEKFLIVDNCGGIPKDIAEKVAFRLGRPSDVVYTPLETVGVYGIGMKRAIFKLGENAVVTSEHNGYRFRVRITKKWLANDDDWQLKLEELPPTGSAGTSIEVTELHPDIKRDFSSPQSTFLSELNRAIRELHAFIIAKGFKVSLNGLNLNPIEFKLLTSRVKDSKAGINPYILRGRFGEVFADIAVGFYRKPLSDDEIEQESEAPKADLSQAGWTIVCNDRLILRSDKSSTTGWGTATVPRFHNQFGSIAGIVSLRSKDPRLLPLTTTKRGIETSSDIYFRLLDYMREGTKFFTNYTNRWKLYLDDTKSQFRNTRSELPFDIISTIPENLYTQVSSKKLASVDAEAKVFTPDLPSPPARNSHAKRISFVKPVFEIETLAKEFLEDEGATPSQIGEACFDVQFAKYKKGSRRT